jgi:hypothetical protein
MKHLLNNLGEEEKNSIREQHAGGMKINTEKFGKLVEAKQGDVKLISEERSKVDKEMILSLILKYAAYFGKENFDDAYDWMENVVGTVEEELMQMGVDQEIVDSLREDYDDLLLAYWEA